MKNKKLYDISFVNVKYDELTKIVNLDRNTGKTIFAEWFNFPYAFADDETALLSQLIETHEPYLLAYSEEELKMKFIAPMLFRVNFNSKNFREWYERPLQATINGVKFGGITDFMVAQGIEMPQKPYFFIQEFKKEDKSSHPKNQLLAEMLVAIELNKVNLMRGAYIIGRNWNFMILEKIAENSYEYFISDSFDSLNFNGLKQIYICLQAVKLKYCE